MQEIDNLFYTLVGFAMILTGVYGVGEGHAEDYLLGWIFSLIGAFTMTWGLLNQIALVWHRVKVNRKTKLMGSDKHNEI